MPRPRQAKSPRSSGRSPPPWRALEVVISGCRPTGMWHHGTHERMSLRAGQCLYVPAGSCRELFWNEASLFLGIVIRESCLRFVVGDLAGDGVWPSQPAWQFHTDTPPSTAILHIGRCLDELALQPHPSPAAAPLAEALCRLCVEALALAPPPQPSKAQRTWQATCAYVEERLGTPISRPQVARAMGVSPAYVSRLFQRQAGVGFHAYLTRLRLEMATRLLRETDLRGKEVASQVGFADERYFIRVFHQQTGLSPGRYRRQFRG